ncbi:PAS domain-containing hybrid sensor histidine kinase/response regulator [Sediminicola luteus]|uniref:histidine kinase n=1 Tax=Sediminicola luteus TaxID=319238 RepID=A0A2A4G7W9_9FLAO|nr:PAS domain-containing sensor histidine kinase [Sediminicola luteus]PCE64086.1 hypothetical protein B7P33_12695 [Sediminicola luteus]
MHRLLKRQILKAKLSESTLKEIGPFLDHIDSAYRSFESDIYHIETILEKSSKELFQTNKLLKHNMQAISSQLERVAGNIKEVIFEIDLNGYWSYLNPAWEQLTGCSVADCLGQPCTQHLTDGSGNPIIDLMAIQLAGPKTYNLKTACKPSCGPEKWCDFSVKAIYDETGRIEGYIGTIVDITNLKETEFALIRAKEKETLANRAKDQFLSTMSHEIRTPLHGVIGLSHLLLAENPKPEQMENLTALKYSSEHLLSLVTDILDYNKITSGNLNLEEAEFSLDCILTGMKSIFQHRAQQKNIAFNIRTDHDLPDLFLGDATRISQILTNLIGNAIKFTEHGSVLVEVETIKHQGQGQPLRFKVSDTGIGISNQKIEKIFHSFVQANLDTTRKYGGTGLGLAICKELLELMGSQLGVESNLGKGSVFSFDIILNLPESQDHLRNIEVHEDYPMIKTTMENCRILIAEDNRVNTLIIKKLMKNWGVSFDIVENGLLALEKAMTQNYDLILMDLQMPVMNGYDATRAIRQSLNSKNNSIPIYALSASCGMDINHKLNEYGLNGLIRKPFDPSELKKNLLNIVNRNTVATDKVRHL